MPGDRSESTPRDAGTTTQSSRLIPCGRCGGTGVASTDICRRCGGVGVHPDR